MLDQATGGMTVPLARSRYVKAHALFYSGLIGLFLVSATIWAALSVVISSLLPGWSSVAITSDSMAPTIRRGDIVAAAPHDGALLGPGSVIVFDYGEGADLVTHRIAGMTGDGSYVTRGDANEEDDSAQVTADQIVGVGRILVPVFGLPLVWGIESDWAKLTAWALAMGGCLVLSRYAFIDPVPD